MKNIKKIILSFLLCYCCINSNGQAYRHYIDSLKILPPNPTIDDTIKVVCFTDPLFRFCKDYGLPPTITINNFKISANTDYTIGIHGCDSLIDTIIIGKLIVGDYRLNYQIHNVTGGLQYGIDSINFMVSLNNSILEKYIELLPVIYPNLSTGYFTIQLSSQSISAFLEVYNLTGQLAYTKQLTSSKTQINPSLQTGIYICKIKPDYQEAIERKLVIIK